VKRLILIAGALLAVVAAPAPATAAPATWSVPDLENQLMCPVCHDLLSQSQSAAANSIRQYIQQKHDAGWSRQRVLNALVAQYGQAILAAPPKHGFGLVAWVVPGLVLLLGIAVAVVLAMAWSRSRSNGGGVLAADGPLDPELERRIDRELRDDDP
jgi:cytochrome c-type biogenesis protein CcmH/NrfF